jgi:hypothetical protein
MCHKDIRIRGASRVVREIIHSFRTKCQYCQKQHRLSEIEAHELKCGQVTCDNPLCNKQLENQKYYEIVTSEGKLSVCNEICENLAKFKRIKNKKDYIDCLKFFQSNLSSGKTYTGATDMVGGAPGGDGEEQRPDGENGGAQGDDMRVLRRIECMSPDFFRQM